MTPTASFSPSHCLCDVALYEFLIWKLYSSNGDQFNMHKSIGLIKKCANKLEYHLFIPKVPSSDVPLTPMCKNSQFVLEETSPLENYTFTKSVRLPLWNAERSPSQPKKTISLICTRGFGPAVASDLLQTWFVMTDTEPHNPSTSWKFQNEICAIARIWTESTYPDVSLLFFLHSYSGTTALEKMIQLLAYVQIFSLIFFVIHAWSILVTSADFNFWRRRHCALSEIPRSLNVVRPLKHNITPAIPCFTPDIFCPSGLSKNILKYLKIASILHLGSSYLKYCPFAFIQWLQRVYHGLIKKFHFPFTQSA